jgi:protein TonB
MHEAAPSRSGRIDDGGRARAARLTRPSASRRGIWFGAFVAVSLAAHAAVAGVLLLEREAPTPLPVVTVELDLRAPGIAGRTAPARPAARTGLATRKAAAGRKVAEKPRKPVRTRPQQKTQPPEQPERAKPKPPSRPKLVATRRSGALSPDPASRPVPSSVRQRPVARLHKAAVRRPVVLRAAPPLPPPASSQEIARFNRALPVSAGQRRHKVRENLRRRQHHRTTQARRVRQPVNKPTRQVAARPSSGAPAGAVVPPRPAGGLGGNPTPHYPREARDNGWQGRVVLAVRVGADGRAAAVSVRRSSGYAALDNSARQAVQRWRFRPATQGGVAVAASVLVPIRFRLRR